MVFEIMAFLALAVWSYLAVGRGGFWRCAERDDSVPVASDAKLSNAPESWPAVVAIIPFSISRIGHIIALIKILIGNRQGESPDFRSLSQ